MPTGGVGGVRVPLKIHGAETERRGGGGREFESRHSDILKTAKFLRLLRTWQFFCLNNYM